MGKFQERLIAAMEICGMSQADLAERTKLSKPRISQYVNGIYEAKQDALLKLSKALNVDVAWLMGYDVPMNKKLDDLAKDTVRDNMLLDLFHQLNDDGKAQAMMQLKIMTMMDDFKENKSG